MDSNEGTALSCLITKGLIMVRHEAVIPLLENKLFLTYLGMETDLIFNRRIDLPGFASYPLLETQEGRETLLSYYAALVGLARELGVGAIIDSTTWVANRDRGAEIGHLPASLKKLNNDAISLISQVREQNTDVPIVLCAQVGPRGDGYAPAELMTAEEAEIYHSEQIKTLSQTEADFICASTLCYPEEAIGIVRSAKRFNIPVAISFTLETDGHLPTGMSMKDAISAVDNATDGTASHFMINCAHPEHFCEILVDEPWLHRIKGIVVNASRCSHAELDEAEALDDGNPTELGILVGDLLKKFPHLLIVGGCCGTNTQHLEYIVEKILKG